MIGRAQEVPATWMITGLGANGPDPELKEKLQLFGQFVGDWEIDGQWVQPDGTRIHGTGELHVAWILDGRAVQDLWINYKQDPPQRVAAGTTIRFYDPKVDAWHCVWISPLQNIVRAFQARQIGQEIVLEGTTPEGIPERWIFSEITPRSFRWRAVESRDDQKTWQLTEEMSLRRVGPQP